MSFHTEPDRHGDCFEGIRAALYIEGGLVLAIFIIGAAIAHFSTVLR